MQFEKETTPEKFERDIRIDFILKMVVDMKMNSLTSDMITRDILNTLPDSTLEKYEHDLIEIRNRNSSKIHGYFRHRCLMAVIEQEDIRRSSQKNPKYNKHISLIKRFYVFIKYHTMLSLLIISRCCISRHSYK